MSYKDWDELDRILEEAHRPTFTQRMLCVVGWTVDGSGLWWNDSSGSTHLKTWPKGTGDVLGFLFGLAIVFAVSGGWIPYR